MNPFNAKKSASLLAITLLIGSPSLYGEEESATEISSVELAVEPAKASPIVAEPMNWQEEDAPEAEVTKSTPEEKAPEFPFNFETTGQIALFTGLYFLWNERVNDGIKAASNPGLDSDKKPLPVGFIGRHVTGLTELSKIVASVFISDPLKEQLKLIKNYAWYHAKKLYGLTLDTVPNQ